MNDRVLDELKSINRTLNAILDVLRGDVQHTMHQEKEKTVRQQVQEQIAKAKHEAQLHFKQRNSEFPIND